jgi:hypothetical protein
MLVYNFVNAKYGLENIEKRRLKISNLMALNDPFEFLGCDLQDKVFRRKLKEVKAEMAKQAGVLCFSASWHSPAQWAHYLGGHLKSGH